jgi:exonuclease VII large subunit
MMLTGNALTNYLTREFTPTQAAMLSEVITSAYANLVKASDFNELKEIVRDLAEAQQRTEQNVDRLSHRMEELAEAQRQTDQAVKELTEAQRQTDQTVKELAEAQRRTEESVRILANGLDQTRSELAGLGRTFGYALENEAYRVLPTLLRERFNIEIRRRFVRAFIGEQEVNLLAEGQQNGESVLVVGEAKTYLGTDDFERLEESLEAVRQAQASGELPAYRIVPLFVAHMARPAALHRAKKEGIIVVQSFEW